MISFFKGFSLTSVFLLFSLNPFSQTNQGDKLRQLQYELAKKRAENQSEFLGRADVDSLMKAIAQLRGNSKKSIAFVFDIVNTFGDVNTFNAYLKNKNLKSIDRNFIGFGVGMGWKNGNRISSFQYVLISIAHKTSNDSLTVRANTNSGFNYSWGYDLLSRSDFIDAYPFIGLGTQSNVIRLRKENYVPPVQSDPTQLFQKNNSVNLNNFFVTYLAGVGVDLRITTWRRGGMMLGLKYCYTGKIGKGEYKPDVGELKFDDGPKYNQSILLSVKLFGKI